MHPQPKLFIGSSSEARAQAEELAQAFAGIADVQPWWNAPEFAPMSGTLEALIASAQEYDFGVFLMTPDDAIESRGAKGHTARDNVLFELGLFLGELGRNRCFALIQQGPNSRTVKVPSDLAGITIPRFQLSEEHDVRVSLERACTPIQSIVRKMGFRELGFPLVDGWSYLADKNHFRMVLSEALLAESFHRLEGRSLVLVVRRRNDAIDRDSDSTVVMGEPRRVPRGPQRIVLEVECGSLLKLDGEPVLDGLLYLMPAASKAKLENVSTIEDILRLGGRLVEARGRGISDYLEDS